MVLFFRTAKHKKVEVKKKITLKQHFKVHTALGNLAWGILASHQRSRAIMTPVLFITFINMCYPMTPLALLIRIQNRQLLRVSAIAVGL